LLEIINKSPFWNFILFLLHTSLLYKLKLFVSLSKTIGIIFNLFIEYINQLNYISIQLSAYNRKFELNTEYKKY
jgi:hypothetical protein